MARKYIFVVGGVMSGVGKGIATASIGVILKSKGYRVTAIKCDPYVNVDAGTMNPTEHGEVFVLSDGDKCDQDMGNYERFLDETLTRTNYMTTGRVYQSVIERERNLGYAGKCVQVVPHVPEEIIKRISTAGAKANADIVITEIGGTVGEYENLLFLEAARMIKLAQPKDVVFILVSYLPIPSKIGEMKTKPTQHASRVLNSYGIQTNFILCRSEFPIDDIRREKLAVFSSIKPENAISAPDVESIYDIPINFEKENLGEKILKELHLESKKTNLTKWRKMVDKIKNIKKEVKIAIVGKHFDNGNFFLTDSYVSVVEAVKHAAWSQNLKPAITWLSSEECEKSQKKLEEFEGIIIPDGLGSSSVEGKIAITKYCRKNKIPYFGIGHGMQIATIEFARNVCEMKKANSEEIYKQTTCPIIHATLKQTENLDESMRLGAYECVLYEKTKAYSAFTKIKNPVSGRPPTISERHQHCYEFNNRYRKELTDKGLIISGVNPKHDLVEIIELKDHPFFMGTQFHPEFQSRPNRPHPLFYEFINVASKRK